jgi:hypothetical protein
MVGVLIWVVFPIIVVSYAVLCQNEVGGPRNVQVMSEPPRILPADWGRSGADNLGIGNFDDIVSGKVQIVFDSACRPHVTDRRATP